MRTIVAFISLGLIASPELAQADDLGDNVSRPQIRGVDLTAQPAGPTPVPHGSDEFTTARPSPGGGGGIPGDEYPRKHTLFLNFVGANLQAGSDNSAEDQSSLAVPGSYPAYTGTESAALAIVQAVEADVAQFGILVHYLERPSQTVPYTMVMIGGDWTDTNLDTPAGNASSGVDCGALWQRHIAYAFASGGTNVSLVGNAVSQAAARGWGLDHTFNCGSVMSYCGSGDAAFSNTCDLLCEAQCAGLGTIGCLSTHETFCGVGSNRQDEVAELSSIFGGNEPDMEPPAVEIQSPVDGSTHPDGASVSVRATVSDNYGGFGWKFVVVRDGDTVYDEVDYDRTVDDQNRAALDLANLPPGDYSVAVQAEDHFGHITEDAVAFVVEVEAGESTGSSSGTEGSTGSSTGDSSSTGDGSSTSDGSTSGFDSTGESPSSGSGSTSAPTSSSGSSNTSDSPSGSSTTTGAGTDDGSSGAEMDGDLDDGGCQCNSNRDAPPWGTLMLVPLLGWGLSRRSRTRIRR